ncbi:MAG: FtsB family cell division protein [Prevotella sp.]
MPNKLTGFWKFVSHYKYAIVIIVGTLVVVFFDENSVVRRIQLDLQIDDLEDEISSYRQRNADNVRRLNELKRNPTAIEKIAREQYFMKADNEDNYVLSDDKKAPDPNDNLSETGDNE